MVKENKKNWRGDYSLGKPEKTTYENLHGAFVAGVKVHPLTESFPEYEDTDKLKGSIILIGQQQPVVFWRDESDPHSPLTLADGRHRIKSMGGDLHRLKYVVYTCSETAIIEFILAHNFHHRHLATGQQAIIFAEAKVMLEEIRDKASNSQGQRSNPELTQQSDPRQIAARIDSIGSKISSHAKADAAHVVSKGTKSLQSATKRGTIGVAPAADAAKSLTDEGQEEVVELVKSGKSGAAAVRAVKGEGKHLKPGVESPKPNPVLRLELIGFTGDVQTFANTLSRHLTEKHFGEGGFKLTIS